MLLHGTGIGCGKIMSNFKIGDLVIENCDVKFGDKCMYGICTKLHDDLNLEENSSYHIEIMWSNGFKFIESIEDVEKV